MNPESPVFPASVSPSRPASAATAVAAQIAAAGVHTVPLYTRPADLGASFQLRVPGGTEQWCCTATADDQPLRLQITFVLGCTRHHARRPYLRQNRRYRRRPTEIPPPLPAEYPCVHLQLFRQEQLIVSLLDDSANTAAARLERLDVSIARNRLWADLNGTVHLHAAPRTTVALTQTRLQFQPADPTAGWTADPADPLAFHFSGTFRVTGLLRGLHAAAGQLPAELPFGGQGCVQHRVTLGPNSGISEPAAAL